MALHRRQGGAGELRYGKADLVEERDHLTDALDSVIAHVHASGEQLSTCP